MRSRLPHKKDGNHLALAKAFTQLGCSVLDLSMVGDDCPDVLVGVGNTAVLVEFKLPKAKGQTEGRLSEGQQRFMDGWRGPVAVARTQQDVIDIVTRHRRVAR